MSFGESASKSDPALSAILVVGGQRRRASRALKSILDQETTEPIEVVLIDCASPAHPPLPGSDDSRVPPSFRVGPDRTFAERRCEGVHAAQARVVAFVEEHSLTFPGWAQALIEAHRGKWAAVGCSFEAANFEMAQSVIIFKNSYGDYQPDRSPGETQWISGHNSSYKRQALIDFGDQLGLLLSCDVVLHRALAERGLKIYYEPKAHMAHLSEDNVLDFAWGVYAWNWCYSAVRIRYYGWSLPWRIVYALGLPLMPLYRTLKILLQSSRRGWVAFFQALIDTPVTLLLNSCAANGQAAGLFLPHDDIERRFSFYEMHTPRTSARDFDP